MKLLRHGPAGAERPGLMDADGAMRDLSDHVSDLSSRTLSRALLQRLARIDPATLPRVPSGTRLGPPVAEVGKFVGIGLNFRDHAEEAGMPIPAEPVIFLKATSCIAGPDEPVRRPRGSTQMDWEVELGIVIAERAHDIDPSQAAAVTAGFCIVNDISERGFQIGRPGGQWDKGKGCDGFGPVGPWLVTPDELPDPLHLEMSLDLNGEPQQRGNTRTMIFGWQHLVADVSRYMTLLPGDLITTGTPPGVGMGRKPPRFLADGDVMTLRIEGLGSQRQVVLPTLG